MPELTKSEGPLNENGMSDFLDDRVSTAIAHCLGDYRNEVATTPVTDLRYFVDNQS